MLSVGPPETCPWLAHVSLLHPPTRQPCFSLHFNPATPAEAELEKLKAAVAEGQAALKALEVDAGAVLARQQELQASMEEAAAALAAARQRKEEKEKEVGARGGRRCVGCVYCIGWGASPHGSTADSGLCPQGACVCSQPNRSTLLAPPSPLLPRIWDLRVRRIVLMGGSLQPPKQVGVIRSVEVEVEGALDKLRAGRKEATARVKDLTKKVDADTAALAKYTSECGLGGWKGHWAV